MTKRTNPKPSLRLTKEELQTKFQFKNTKRVCTISCTPETFLTKFSISKIELKQLITGEIKETSNGWSI